MQLLSRTVVAVGAAAGLLIAAGCTSDKKQATPVSSTPKPSPTLKQNPLPSSVANNVGLRKNVAITSCAAALGGWGAAGTAKNPDKTARTYHLTVYFTTDKATTLDYAQTSVTVGAGGQAGWKANKKFSAANPMLCVLVGVS